MRPIRYTDSFIIEKSKKYSTKKDFRTNNPYLYWIASQHKILKSFVWLKRCKNNVCIKKWTKEATITESRKYEGLGVTAFKKNANGAYRAAYRNGWISEFSWLNKKTNPYQDSIMSVYRYEFIGFNAVYIGITQNIERRRHDHKFGHNKKKSSVLKFAESHGVEVPNMVIIANGLTIEKAQRLEGVFVKAYKIGGWNVLNKKPTGVGRGSIGSTSRKWTKTKTRIEALKYQTRGAFYKGSPSAYEKARTHHWLEEWYGR